jgi:hypothetical protein
MIKLDENYTDYRDDSDENYICGKAVDAEDEESYEATPIKAPLINDFLGAFRSVYKKAFGNLDISNVPDNENVSDFLSALLKLIFDSPAFINNPTAPTQNQTDSSTKLATTEFVKAAITALIDSSPGTLDTLNELAAALGDDPNFATTMINALAGKAPVNTTLTDEEESSTLPATTDTPLTTLLQSVRNFLKYLGNKKAPLANPALTGTPTAPTAAKGTNSTQIATTAFVEAAITALVDSSPATLDTLNELAAALGDDPNFATTMINALAGKAPLASPALTGTPTAPTAAKGTNTTQIATTEFVKAAVNALFDLEHPVGDLCEQFPSTKSPVEKGWPGTWKIWSHRAVLYGVSTSTLPSYSTYSQLVASAIAAGSRPYALYTEPGGDSRLYRFKSHTDAYTVPADFDPVQWDRYATGVTIVPREEAGNALTDTDLAIGAKIATGTYVNRYVTEIIVPGGKFWSVEGGNRPTFEFDGVQPDRIRNLTGKARLESYITNALGALYGTSEGDGGISASGYTPDTLNFDASRVVPTAPDGSDNAPANLSVRFWRRVS